MSAPTNTKPSFLSRIGAQARRVLHSRLSSHWGLATAADDDSELTDRTPTAPTPISSPPDWTRAAPPFTPLRAARPASPVPPYTPLTLSSLGSSSSTLSEWFQHYYPDQDNALRTPSSDNGDRILVKKPSDNVFESVVEASETLPPSPKSNHLLANSPRIHGDEYDDDDDMDIGQDLEDPHQIRSPPRHSRSPSPTSSIRGLPPSSPREHDDEEDADNMDISVSEVVTEQDAVADDEDMCDVAAAPAAPAAALTTARAQHPLATRDNMDDFVLAENPPARLLSTSSMTPASASNGSDLAPLVGLASGLSPALLPPAATFVVSAPSSSSASRSHLPLPAPIIGKRARDDSDDERVAKKAKEPSPPTQQPLKRERRAAKQRAWHKTAALAINADDDVLPTTEHMEVDVDDGAVAAPDTFDRDWTSGTPIANVAPAAVAAFFKRTTDISRIIVDWEDSLCVSVRTQWSGKGRFDQCVPDVLRHLNTTTTVLVLGDTVPDEHLDALEAATELDAEVLIVRVSGNDDAPLFKRKSTLLALRSLRQVFFVSVGCGEGTRHSVPWEDAHHLMNVVIRTERKPDVDHKNISIVGAGDHQDELRNVGFSL